MVARAPFSSDHGFRLFLGLTRSNLTRLFSTTCKKRGKETILLHLGIGFVKVIPKLDRQYYQTSED